jgi:hypothetical protein
MRGNWFAIAFIASVTSLATQTLEGYGRQVSFPLPANSAGRTYGEPRPGAPRTVSDGQVEQVVIQTLENRPRGQTHWSTLVSETDPLSRSFHASPGLRILEKNRVCQDFCVNDLDFVLGFGFVVALGFAVRESWEAVR